MKRILFILYISILITACKSSVYVAESQFKRPPLVNVEQEALDREVKLLAAKTQQEVGSHSEALGMYDSLLAKYPDYGPANYEKAGLLLKGGRLTDALECSLRAVKSDPSNVWYQLRLASIYEQMQDGTHLAATWETIVKQHPQTLDYYYELSNAYIMANDIPSAVAVLNRVEKMVGVTEMVSLQKQRLWEAYGKHDKAQKEIEILAAAMPQEVKYSAILAEIFMKQKQYAKAKVCYDRILAAKPDDEYIHISLASYYKAVGNGQQAYQELRIAFMNENIDPTSKLQILGGFYPNGEFYGSGAKYAFPLLDLVMGQCKDKTAYALFYGDVLMRQGKYAEAVDQFRLALQKDSSTYEVWEAMLVCLSETDDEAAMLDFSRRAQALFPLHPLPYYLQAVVSYNHGHDAEVLEFLQRVENLGFNKGYLEKETYNLMAMSHYRMGERQAAFDYFEKYLTLNPDDVGILNNFAYFLSESGERLDQAEQMARKALSAEPENPTILDTYAWVLHRMGRSKEALPYAQKAVKLNPSSESLRHHLDEIRKAL